MLNLEKNLPYKRQKYIEMGLIVAKVGKPVQQCQYLVCHLPKQWQKFPMRVTVYLFVKMNYTQNNHFLLPVVSAI